MIFFERKIFSGRYKLNIFDKYLAITILIKTLIYITDIYVLSLKMSMVF